MDNNLNWNYIKEFYKEHFGIDSWVVELLANRDILLLCSSGASDRTISTFLDIEEEEVVLVIKESFDFHGWEVDIPLNPYKTYSELLYIDDNEERKQTFITAVSTNLLPYKEFSTLDIDALYQICVTMAEIDERIYDEWV
jgi:hypothetical protein